MNAAGPSYGICYERSVLCPQCHNPVAVLWQLWEGRVLDVPVCRACLDPKPMRAHDHRRE